MSRKGAKWTAPGEQDEETRASIAAELALVRELQVPGRDRVTLASFAPFTPPSRQRVPNLPLPPRAGEAGLPSIRVRASEDVKGCVLVPVPESAKFGGRIPSQFPDQRRSSQHWQTLVVLKCLAHLLLTYVVGADNSCLFHQCGQSGCIAGV